MTIWVKYLSEEAIEKDAEALLAEFAHARSVKLEPPIPIEVIVEKHLKLRIEFDNLHHVLGAPQEGLEPDILGAIWADRREICIDQSLDPEDRPSIESRYRFTVAHEGGGHWRLHRAYLAIDPDQASLFGDSAQPAVVCRSSQSKERVELQADIYAACLLMPRKLVMSAWVEMFPDRCRHVMDRSKRDAISTMPDIEEREFEAKVEEWENERSMEDFARPLAEQFLVSPIAMRIRLEKLGLLLREVPYQRVFAGG
jgi:hypothetical protein